MTGLRWHYSQRPEEWESCLKNGDLQLDFIKQTGLLMNSERDWRFLTVIKILIQKILFCHSLKGLSRIIRLNIMITQPKHDWQYAHRNSTKSTME